jgi:hypothetical protein
LAITWIPKRGKSRQLYACRPAPHSSTSRRIHQTLNFKHSFKGAYQVPVHLCKLCKLHSGALDPHLMASQRWEQFPLQPPPDSSVPHVFLELTPPSRGSTESLALPPRLLERSNPPPSAVAPFQRCRPFLPARPPPPPHSDPPVRAAHKGWPPCVQIGRLPPHGLPVCCCLGSPSATDWPPPVPDYCIGVWVAYESPTNSELLHLFPLQALLQACNKWQYNHAQFSG